MSKTIQLGDNYRRLWPKLNDTHYFHLEWDDLEPGFVQQVGWITQHCVGFRTICLNCTKS